MNKKKEKGEKDIELKDAKKVESKKFSSFKKKKKVKKNIKNISPFQAQSQIMPEDEKRKLIKLYDNIKLDEKLISDLVIIRKNNKFDKFENFKIHNTKYNLVYSSNVYDIFQIN